MLCILFDNFSIVNCIVSRGRVNSKDSISSRSQSVYDNSDCDETMTQVNSSSVKFNIIIHHYPHQQHAKLSV